MHLSDKIFADVLYFFKVLYHLKQAFIHVPLDFLDKCNEHREILKSKIINLLARLCLKIHIRELNRIIESKTFDLKSYRDKLKRNSEAALKK